MGGAHQRLARPSEPLTSPMPHRLKCLSSEFFLRLARERRLARGRRNDRIGHFERDRVVNLIEVTASTARPAGQGKAGDL